MARPKTHRYAVKTIWSGAVQGTAEGDAQAWAGYVGWAQEAGGEEPVPAMKDARVQEGERGRRKRDDPGQGGGLALKFSLHEAAGSCLSSSSRRSLAPRPCT